MDLNNNILLCATSESKYNEIKNILCFTEEELIKISNITEFFNYVFEKQLKKSIDTNEDPYTIITGIKRIWYWFYYENKSYNTDIAYINDQKDVDEFYNTLIKYVDNLEETNIIYNDINVKDLKDELKTERYVDEENIGYLVINLNQLNN